MLKAVIRYKLRCPEHSRYNPEKDGLRYKLNCPCCDKLWKIYRKQLELIAMVEAAK